MPSSKRPPANESPGGTLVVGPEADDETVATEPIGNKDQLNNGQRQVAPAAETPQYGDEAPGATAFVRVDRGPAPPRRATEKQPLAPKKGLQVTLPDDEPTPPPPKKVVAPTPPDKKGRRGNWWDAKSEKLPEAEEPPPEPEPPPADDVPGGTALVQRPKPPPEPEPELEPYRPVPVTEFKQDTKQPVWRVWVDRVVSLAIIFAVLGAIGIVAGYFYISREIPTFDSIRDYHPFVASKVVASDGSVVGQFYRERRTIVKMDQVPRVLVQAVISAEDKDFYKHPGFNLIALARAVVVDTISGRKRLGASTITQQVVKNFFLSSEKKWKRKLKELLLASRLERNLSKDDILYLYLNHINFGRAHYGVEEASLYYFNKHVQDIDLGEAAILAGLPQNPSRINPRRHPDRAKKRQVYVLGRMLANRYITDEDYQREVEKHIVLPPAPQELPGAWYLDEVRRQLVAQFGDAPVDTSGMTIEVAMDPKLQSAAEIAVQEGLRAIDKRQGWRGPELRLDLDRLDAYRSALGRKLASVSQTSDQAWVLDLEGIHTAETRKAADKPANKKVVEEGDESDSTADPVTPAGGSVPPDALARAARPRPLETNGVYAGIVTNVTRDDAIVELAPGLTGSVPFATMAWARPFKPERPTPLPHFPADVLSAGDVVPVRVTRFVAAPSSTHLRVTRLELALEQTPKVQGAFVGMDLKTRGVLALVGGYDVAISSFNRATQAKRQPGSSFKPFLYAAALDSGKYTPVTRMDDSPEVIIDPWSGKSWKPQNFEKDEFDGRITLRKALAESKNTVAVKLLLDVGLDKVRSMTRAAGLSSEVPQSYTAALGTGEVGVLEEINGYATLASQGRRADPVLIKRVVARDGSTILAAAVNPDQAIKPETAYLTADLMRSVIEDPAGTAHSLSALGRTVAGKTGTASDHRDAWFIGFTPSLLAGGWVGFDSHEMLGPLETGGHAAGPIWLSWMRTATAGTPKEEWPPPPPGVTVLKINRNTGALARESDPYAVREVFMAGSEPTQTEEEEPSQEDWYQVPAR